MVQQRAAKNLAALVTYQEWQGHLCGLLLLAAHRTKAMRPQDHCTAVAPPSPPFCSGNNERLLAAETQIHDGLTFTCVNNSNNIWRACIEKKDVPFLDTWVEMHASARLMGPILNFSLKDSLLFRLFRRNVCSEWPLKKMFFLFFTKCRSAQRSHF